ncbi:hypothetical protein FGU65_02025 [Methanoculleus sp. FWC-SCC1]|uniref:Uncharacterized protein n=1 Tax=Methanoculleus frigidifontis TaxID=2584085 RepID=A0ABT8M6Y7_9EURY|nr:hypothetical protein [Methanoculleus sp. FWC-SCC1]MDN7023686.1 hypothetical protein [Methanoculleus sp. FWC-SCC1]
MGGLLNACVDWCTGVSNDKATIVSDTLHHPGRPYGADGFDGGVAVKVCILRGGKFEATTAATPSPMSRTPEPCSPAIQDEVYPTVADAFQLPPRHPAGTALGKEDRTCPSDLTEEGAARYRSSRRASAKAGIEPISDGYELLYKPDAAGLAEWYALGQENRTPRKDSVIPPHATYKRSAAGGMQPGDIYTSCPHPAAPERRPSLPIYMLPLPSHPR